MTDAITIYHNPRCSKSRQTLTLIEAAGVSPNIQRYLDTPLTAEELTQLLSKLGITARNLLRKGEEAYKQNNLDEPSLSEDELIAVMVKYPKLIERPIVVKGRIAVLGRPPENVLALL